MWNAFSISASGLAASAAQLSSAAGKVANAFTGGSAPQVPQAQPAAPPPAAPPAANPLSAGTLVAAQSSNPAANPASWMVEILEAKAAYSANAAMLKTADQMARQTVDLSG